MSDLPPLDSTQPSDAPPPRGLPPEQLAALAAAPVEPLLAPLLLPGTLTLIQGPRGVGMSQVMAGCAVAMAAGGGCLGWQAPRPRAGGHALAAPVLMLRLMVSSVPPRGICVVRPSAISPASACALGP